jgi:hypothetical protein
MNWTRLEEKNRSLIETLSQDLPGGAEDNHKNLNQDSHILKQHCYTHCFSAMIIS